MSNPSFWRGVNLASCLSEDLGHEEPTILVANHSSDTIGMEQIRDVLMTPDGRYYLYGGTREVNNLFVVNRLKQLSAEASRVSSTEGESVGEWVMHALDITGDIANHCARSAGRIIEDYARAASF